MTFDLSHSLYRAPAIAADAPRAEWRPAERLVVLVGACAGGAVAGFIATMFIGRVDIWVVVLTAVPALALALHLTSHTLYEAVGRGAYGCAGAAVLHGAALLAWPIASLMAPSSPMAFWFAPLIALAALALLACCWTGSPKATYRMSVQAVLIAALATQQGMFLIMGA